MLVDFLLLTGSLWIVIALLLILIVVVRRLVSTWWGGCACVVCGCVGVWVCGCVSVWVCGCVGVWVGGLCVGCVWAGRGRCGGRDWGVVGLCLGVGLGCGAGW